jgi:hypothetical protein
MPSPEALESSRTLGHRDIGWRNIAIALKTPARRSKREIASSIKGECVNRIRGNQDNESRLMFLNTKTLVFFLVGLGLLQIAVVLILVWATPIRYHNDTILSFVYLGMTLGWVASIILWTQRGYGRRWQRFRARSWRQISGKFDDGEIVAMRKGRSRKIAGYQVRLGYDYLADGEQTGLYTLPFVGEFPSEEVAEKYRKQAANRDVVVRVSPRNPNIHVCLMKTCAFSLANRTSRCAMNC